MKLSRTVGYALQATLQLLDAEPYEPVPCSRLATTGQMPERFLLQILRDLVTHGILRSTRGVDGGYTLHRSADDVSLLDIIEAVDGPIQDDPPRIDGLPIESREQLAAAMKDVNETIREKLAAIRLSSLAGKTRPRTTVRRRADEPVLVN